MGCRIRRHHLGYAGHLGYGLPHHLGKREADPEADAAAYYGYGYGHLGYGHLGYAGYGYGHHLGYRGYLGYAGLHGYGHGYRAGMKFQFFVRPGKFQCPRNQTMKTLLILFARFDLESRKWRIKIYFQNL